MRKTIIFLSSLLLLAGCNNAGSISDEQTSSTSDSETYDISAFEVPHREISEFPSLEGYDYAPIPDELKSKIMNISEDYYFSINYHGVMHGYVIFSRYLGGWGRRSTFCIGDYLFDGAGGYNDATILCFPEGADYYDFDVFSGDANFIRLQDLYCTGVFSDDDIKKICYEDFAFHMKNMDEEKIEAYKASILRTWNEILDDHRFCYFNNFKASDVELNYTSYKIGLPSALKQIVKKGIPDGTKNGEQVYYTGCDMSKVIYFGEYNGYYLFAPSPLDENSHKLIYQPALNQQFNKMIYFKNISDIFAYKKGSDSVLSIMSLYGNEHGLSVSQIKHYADMIYSCCYDNTNLDKEEFNLRYKDEWVLNKNSGTFSALWF